MVQALESRGPRESRDDVPWQTGRHARRRRREWCTWGVARPRFAGWSTWCSRRSRCRSWRQRARPSVNPRPAATARSYAALVEASDEINNQERDEHPSDAPPSSSSISPTSRSGSAAGEASSLVCREATSVASSRSPTRTGTGRRRSIAPSWSPLSVSTSSGRRVASSSSRRRASASPWSPRTSHTRRSSSSRKNPRCNGDAASWLPQPEPRGKQPEDDQSLPRLQTRLARPAQTTGQAATRSRRPVGEAA